MCGAADQEPCEYGSYSDFFVGHIVRFLHSVKVIRIWPSLFCLPVQWVNYVNDRKLDVFIYIHHTSWHLLAHALPDT